MTNSLIATNSYQTKVNDILKASVPKEIWEELLEYLGTVQFISHLIAPEEVRGFAKDLKVMQRKVGTDLFGNPIFENFKDGRKQINITRPHILEDMDFFRERALFFEKNGKYTNIPVNPNPKSEYGLFWKEELRRWKFGLVRESDGEWIPGGLYFYWNYTPIWLTKQLENLGGDKTMSERV